MRRWRRGAAVCFNGSLGGPLRAPDGTAVSANKLREQGGEVVRIREEVLIKGLEEFSVGSSSSSSSWAPGPVSRRCPIGKECERAVDDPSRLSRADSAQGMRTAVE